MALELILTADTLASLKVQVAAWHHQLNSDAPAPADGNAGQKAPAPKEPKAEKPKAEKPAAKPSTEQAVDVYTEALKEPAKEAAPLDYAKDVVSKILAKVAELQAAGKSPADAKAAVQDVIRSTYGVANAKEVPADQWPALLEAVAKVPANG